MRRVYSRDDVSSHQSKEDGGVWVIYDGLVLDVTDFMHDHPGGDELITRFAGKDITAVYASDKYHMHSKTSLSILQSLVIGSVEGHSGGPLFGAVALSTANYAESSKFIDINLPIVPQLLNLKCSKEEYMLQIHRPRHCPQTARIFEWDCMELLTHTPWQAIPVVWGSLAVYMAYLALQTLTFNQFVPTLLGGVMTWSLIEYFVHRFVFHQESMVPAHPIFFTMHFLTHALHHFLPMEKYASSPLCDVFADLFAEIALSCPFLWQLQSQCFSFISSRHCFLMPLRELLIVVRLLVTFVMTLVISFSTTLQPIFNTLRTSSHITWLTTTLTRILDLECLLISGTESLVLCCQCRDITACFFLFLK
eukprot:TRINITY_DN5129_c0_g1_i1.p1 TRINITY_DN5129_c0_g1~~TRINITY_DN5129_c0_g1_i1.p1  ORF type:complete len:364 (-),score=52.19 TRINITY_DN5129_c0_g1_i1:826-1917(-)